MVTLKILGQLYGRGGRHGRGGSVCRVGTGGSRRRQGVCKCGKIKKMGGGIYFFKARSVVMKYLYDAVAR